MSIFFKSKKAISMPKLDGCDSSLNEIVFKNMTRGNFILSYNLIRRFCDSNWVADSVANTLIATHGFKIELDGKLYDHWL